MNHFWWLERMSQPHTLASPSPPPPPPQLFNVAHEKQGNLVKLITQVTYIAGGTDLTTPSLNFLNLSHAEARMCTNIIIITNVLHPVDSFQNSKSAKRSMLPDVG